MSNAALNALKTNLESLKQSIKWLRRSYDICAEIGIKADKTIKYCGKYQKDFDQLT
jgi:hypothetical protein